MKKKILIITLILLSLILFGCEKKEYALIEISGDEFVDNINNGNAFIYAIYNERVPSKKGFLNDLKKIVKATEQNIYYIDYQHLSSKASIYIIDSIGYDSYYQTYGIYNGEKHELVEDYKDYATMFNSLKSHHYKELKLYDDETRINTLKKAQELYEESKYPEATDTLNSIWNYKEAKNEYSSKPYYKLSNLWEGYEFIDKNKMTMIYRSIIFYSSTKYCSIYESKQEKFDGYKKPAIDQYSRKYYKIDKDIIYFSSKDDGSYHKKYQISKVTEEELILIDLTNKNKEIKMQRRD